MKKILNLFIAIALIGGIIGCEGDKQTQFSAEHQAALDAINAELDSVLAIEADPLTFKFTYGPADYPEVGDNNITIVYTDAGNVMLYVKEIGDVKPKNYIGPGRKTFSYDSVASVVSTPVRSYDLTSESVEIWLTNSGKEFDTKSESHGKLFNGGSQNSIAIGVDFDAKIIPSYQYSGTVTFVGGQDTRDNVTGNKVDYLTCNLAWDYWNRKRVRVWYESGNLYINANKNTVAIKTSLNTCDVLFEGWGGDFNYNPRSKSVCVPPPPPPSIGYGGH